MDKPRPRAMDVTAPRRTNSTSRDLRLTRRQITVTVAGIVLSIAIILGAHWYRYRNAQAILADRYQIVYLQTGQVYFGKLQNTTGDYLTLTKVYMLQDQQDAADAENTSNILQVSRQVYGPDDSMAIRADQVQFWQNLRPDSKVAQAIDSANK